jgi:hypothetical protein
MFFVEVRAAGERKRKTKGRVGGLLRGMRDAVRRLSHGVITVHWAMKS